MDIAANYLYKQVPIGSLLQLPVLCFCASNIVAIDMLHFYMTLANMNIQGW